MLESNIDKREESVEAVLSSTPKKLIWVSSLAYFIIFSGFLLLLWFIKIPENISLEGYLVKEGKSFTIVVADSSVKFISLRNSQIISFHVNDVYGKQVEVYSSIIQADKINGFRYIVIKNSLDTNELRNIFIPPDKKIPCILIISLYNKRMIKKIFTNR
jgi:hypothetical protein